MNNTANLQYQTISNLSEEIRNKRVSPVDIVKVCLDRIQKLNPELNAFITLSSHAVGDAMAAAAEIHKGNYLGPLHGIPVALKDFYDTADMKTTAGFVHFKKRAPGKDADVVTRLRNAGAIILGKTNMHQLGMGTTSTESFFGTVHNPWNVEYIAGGSSGGSAAAVAAGLCFATIDTDAVGSCRLPASCCGVVGFKGTYGLIDTTGILAGEKADEMILQLAHAGITCRSAADVGLVLGAISNAKFNLADNVPAVPVKIGILKDYKADADVEKHFRKALQVLAAFGSVADSLARIPLSDKPSYKASDVAKARGSIADILFKDFDVLVSPTTTASTITIAEAEKRGPMAVSPENTFFCNYFGLPAVSVFCGFDKNGMPLGLQIVGPAGKEDKILRIANQFLNNTKEDARHPKTSADN